MSQQHLDELRRRAKEQLKQIESAKTAPMSPQTVPTAQPAGDSLDFGVSPDPLGPKGISGAPITGRPTTEQLKNLAATVNCSIRRLDSPYTLLLLSSYRRGLEQDSCL